MERLRPRAPLSDDPFEQWILSDTTETYGDWLANAPEREATQLRQILQQHYAAPRFSLAMLLGGIAPALLHVASLVPATSAAANHISAYLTLRK